MLFFDKYQTYYGDISLNPNTSSGTILLLNFPYEQAFQWNIFYTQHAEMVVWDVTASIIVGSVVKEIDDGDEEWFTVLSVAPKTRKAQLFVLNANNL